MADLSARKADHLALVAGGSVNFREKTTLLEEVDLIHDALPELAAAEVDLSVTFLGRRLSAPLLIGAMTGGTPEAFAINRDLALAAQVEGVGFCLGSQRAMESRPELAPTYAFRDLCPDALILGNLGLGRARELGAAAVDALRREVGADGLFIHLNPAMELVQIDGDRDFRGGLETLGALRGQLGERLWVKETGCGLSASVARRLRSIGISTVETAGAGGTSWVAVELARAGAAPAGEAFREWGIPTAASVALCAREGLSCFAGGGLRSGLDVARAMALGAVGGALAAPFFLAQRQGGLEGVRSAIRAVRGELQLAALLTGARTAADLRRVPSVVGPRLAAWLAAR